MIHSSYLEALLIKICLFPFHTYAYAELGLISLRRRTIIKGKERSYSIPYLKHLFKKLLLMMISIYFLLLVPVVSSTTVTLSGGQYCSTDEGDGAHADPGDMISINCAVDSPDNGLNILRWTIFSFGVLVSNIGGDDDNDLDQPEFVSTVNSFDNTLLTTNATLTFPAISDLDGAVVVCSGLDIDITKSCTLLIKSKYI